MRVVTLVEDGVEEVANISLGDLGNGSFVTGLSDAGVDLVGDQLTC
jgi:hypothetical protein